MRVNTHIPVPDSRSSRPRRLLRSGARALAWMALAPPYLALARWVGTPGLHMHLRALRLLGGVALRGSGARVAAIRDVFLPLDSVRYFEFAFAWAVAERAGDVRRHLDLSSPRLFPLCLLQARRGLRADLVNPDGRDLSTTRAFADALGLAPRVALHQKTADGLDLEPESYDLVTSLSVLEHIPAPGDGRAARLLWKLVRPGGRLVVTVPVARSGFDEYLDVDAYGLLPREEGGWTFGQRVYDRGGIRETFLAAVGEPSRSEVFGERMAGTFFADRAAKATGTHRPWREPYAMGTAWRRFPSIDDLPGLGVLGLEFVKPSA